MNEAIKRAIRGGWDPKSGSTYNVPWFGEMQKSWLDIKPTREKELQIFSYSAGYGQGFGDGAIFLDPLFWQALGKGDGWNVEESWLFEWHHFIDHIAEGGTPDDFFNNLLKK